MSDDVTTKQDMVNLAKVYIDDAIVMKMYELQRVAHKNFDQAIDARRAAFEQAHDRITKSSQKASTYRRELKRVNAAHRLLILEHKELKRKYDELTRVIAPDVKAAEITGYNTGYSRGYSDGATGQPPF